MTPNVTALDRLILQLSPQRGLARLRARAVADLVTRHYEAAEPSWRSEHWRRSSTDANAAVAGSLSTLRFHARDLTRNNGWARRGKQVIGNHVVGWGIEPNPTAIGVQSAKRARALWRAWAGTTQCDVDGQHTYAGLQRLAIDTIAESGGVLVRQIRRPLSAGLAIPLQLQVLEPDHIDLAKDVPRMPDGGRIIQGIEFDAQNRLSHLWLFPRHPGDAQGTWGSRLVGSSVQVPIDQVRYIYRKDRPGQVHGIPWFSAAIVVLKEFDEFEDAQLLRQKIAACLAVFITDGTDGTGLSLGTRESASDPLAETISPGSIVRVPMGKQVTVADPPTVAEGGFDQRQLRKAAAAMGITYEDLSGDYSQVNFSSARMSRIAHWQNVADWQWNMFIPGFCDTTYGWAMAQARQAGLVRELPVPEWTTQPMPVIDPEKEAKAAMMLVRTGQRTPDDIVREAGRDPDVFWPAYQASLQRLDTLGIVLDSDARKRTQQGNDPNGRPAQKSPKATAKTA